MKGYGRGGTGNGPCHIDRANDHQGVGQALGRGSRGFHPEDGRWVAVGSERRQNVRVQSLILLQQDHKRGAAVVSGAGELQETFRHRAHPEPAKMVNMPTKSGVE